MYEKYNGFQFATGGGGGEYIPQIGFGWSNAVSLILISQYYLHYPNDDNNSNQISDNKTKISESWLIFIIISSVSIVCLVIIWLFYSFYYKQKNHSTLYGYLIENDHMNMNDINDDNAIENEI